MLRFLNNTPLMLHSMTQSCHQAHLILTAAFVVLVESASQQDMLSASLAEQHLADASQHDSVRISIPSTIDLIVFVTR